jgi:hypothetical protein
MSYTVQHGPRASHCAANRPQWSWPWTSIFFRSTFRAAIGCCRCWIYPCQDRLEGPDPCGPSRQGLNDGTPRNDWPCGLSLLPERMNTRLIRTGKQLIAGDCPSEVAVPGAGGFSDATVSSVDFISTSSQDTTPEALGVIHPRQAEHHVSRLADQTSAAEPTQVRIQSTWWKLTFYA